MIELKVLLGKGRATSLRKKQLIIVKIQKIPRDVIGSESLPSTISIARQSPRPQMSNSRNPLIEFRPSRRYFQHARQLSMKTRTFFFRSTDDLF